MENEFSYSYEEEKEVTKMRNPVNQRRNGKQLAGGVYISESEK